MIISKTPSTARSGPPKAQRVTRKSLKRKRTLSRLAYWTSLLYFAALIAVTVLIWKFAEHWWPATVLLFAPRWTLATPFVVLLPLAVIGNRKSLITLLAAAALMLWPIMGLRLSRASAETTRAPFVRVLTCNIHRQHLNAAEFKSILDDLRPDVVALQDWSSAHEPELFGDSAWNCRRDGEIFIATRYPILKAETIALDEQPKPEWKIREGNAVYYSVQTPLGPINLINLHLSSPHEGIQAVRDWENNAPLQLAFNSKTRGMESASVKRFADALTGPLVIVGDFNTPSESEVYWTHWNGLVDAFDAKGFGFGITHVSTSSSVRLDHILVGPGVDVRQCWLGDTTGSPHKPLVADLGLGN